MSGDRVALHGREQGQTDVRIGCVLILSRLCIEIHA